MYPLEADRFDNNCYGTDNPNLVHWNNIDYRFYDTGGYDTEYDIQSESQVLFQLINMPLYEQYVPNYY